MWLVKLTKMGLFVGLYMVFGICGVLAGSTAFSGMESHFPITRVLFSDASDSFSVLQHSHTMSYLNYLLSSKSR